MKFTTRTWATLIGLVFLYTSLGLILLLPYASNLSIPASIDLLSHLHAITQAKLALANHQFPLRITLFHPDTWAYPFFQFYSPTSYTFAGLVHLWVIPSSPLMTYKITLLVAFITGGIYLYKLCYWCTNNSLAAILGSAAYLLSPYLIIVTHFMFGFNEAIALGLLPAVIYFTLRFFYQPFRLIYFLWVALLWYLLITIHLLTFLSSTCFVFLFLFILTCTKPNFWPHLLLSLCAYAFALLLAMWFLGPVITFGHLLNEHFTFMNANYFYAQSPPLHALLTPFITADPTQLEHGAITYISPAIGLPLFFAASFATYLFFISPPRLQPDSKGWLLPSLCVFYCVLFIAWSPFNFWHALPASFRVIQYSWRTLSQLLWPGALLLALTVSHLSQAKLSPKRLLASLTLILLTSLPWLIYPIDRFTNYTYALKAFRESGFYLLSITKDARFIDLIDSLTLTSSAKDPHLSLTTLKPFITNPAILNASANPYLLLTGYIPDSVPAHQWLFKAVHNGTTIASFPIQPGDYQWKIALPKNTKFDLSKTAYQVQFNLMPLSSFSKEHYSFPLESLVYGGILPKDNIMDASQTALHCHQHLNSILCDVTPSSTTRLIELPVYYYPDLLTFTLNGKPAAYLRILYHDFPVLGVIPEHGQPNHITIQFRGQLWANYLSRTAWQLGLILLIYGLLCVGKRKGVTKVIFRNP